jgi:hypothetical protein
MSKPNVSFLCDEVRGQLAIIEETTGHFPFTNADAENFKKALEKLREVTENLIAKVQIQ